MARVMTSGSVSKAGRPTLGGSEECLSFHQSSTNTYNETKKESRSSMAPSFGESLVHQHTILAPSRFFAITHQTSKKFAPSVDCWHHMYRWKATAHSLYEREEGENAMQLEGITWHALTLHSNQSGPTKKLLMEVFAL